MSVELTILMSISSMTPDWHYSATLYHSIEKKVSYATSNEKSRSA